MTGFNMQGPDSTGNLLDGALGESLDPFLDDYCASHPSHFLAEAMRPLESDAWRDAANRPPTPGSPGPDRKRAHILLAVTCQE